MALHLSRLRCKDFANENVRDRMIYTLTPFGVFLFKFWIFLFPTVFVIGMAFGLLLQKGDKE